MKKNALITQMAEKSGLDAKQAQDALNAFIAVVTDALKAGDKVQVNEFGTFELRQRSERKGHNPSTGEPITIPATKCPSFKPYKSFKNEF